MNAESFRTLLAVTVIKGNKISFFDIETAYLNADLETAAYEVCMWIPTSIQIQERIILLVTGNLYGLPAAERCWYEKLVSIFDKIGLQPIIVADTYALLIKKVINLQQLDYTSMME